MRSTSPPPQTPPIDYFRLAVGDGHDLLVGQQGRRGATPVLFLHGGPGSGCSPDHARVFDPARAHLILPDQRGAGGSRPPGGLRANDLEHLIGDLEAVRQRLGLARWIVYGGSWGATLALEYAKRHPQVVVELILRAPFLARPQDLNAFFGPEGCALAHPDAYRAFCLALGSDDGRDLIARLVRRLNDDADTAYRAARALDTWEATVMGLTPSNEESDPQLRARRVAGKRVYAHYCDHGFFLGPDGVLDGLAKIASIPVAIVHGLQDAVCSPAGTQLLVERGLPNAAPTWVAGAGHALTDARLRAALRGVVDAALERNGSVA
ncbi:MAG: alpha/beta fold hydrolase [Burkholderiaceae bacterium]